MKRTELLELLDEIKRALETERRNGGEEDYPRLYHSIVALESEPVPSLKIIPNKDGVYDPKTAFFLTVSATAPKNAAPRTGRGPKVVAGPSGHKKVKCENCLVKVEYAPKDVQERNGTDYGGGPDGARWINCPGCNEQIILESW